MRGLGRPGSTAITGRQDRTSSAELPAVPLVRESNAGQVAVKGRQPPPGILFDRFLEPLPKCLARTHGVVSRRLQERAQRRDDETKCADDQPRPPAFAYRTDRRSLGWSWTMASHPHSALR